VVFCPSVSVAVFGYCRSYGKGILRVEASSLGVFSVHDTDDPVFSYRGICEEPEISCIPGVAGVWLERSL